MTTRIYVQVADCSQNELDDEAFRLVDNVGCFLARR